MGTDTHMTEEQFFSFANEVVQATVKKSLEEDYDGFVNMLVQDYAARTLERLKADAEFRIQAETVFAAQSGSNA
jgi:hypothetical protein